MFSAALPLFVCLAAAVPVHDEGVSESAITVSDREVVWDVKVVLASLARVGLKFPAEPLDLSEAQLQSVKEDIVKYLQSGLSLEVDGRVLTPKAGALKPIHERLFGFGAPYIERLSQEFRFRLDAPPQRVRVKVRFFSEITSIHTSLVDLSWNGGARHEVFHGPGDLQVTGSLMNPSRLHTAFQFILWGMEHIFKGYDHIAFLLALLLGARGLGQVVKIVTSFTVAHSITLLLAALNVIKIDPRMTETLIAASIVYVAVENYSLGDGRWRWLLTFGFGLIHGLGFSSVLRGLLAEASSIVVPVVSFNVGVELGQIAILLVAYPLILLARRAPDEQKVETRRRRLVFAGSFPILLFGLGWLVERLFGLGFMPL